MTNAPSRTLVLGGTGKTGSRVARKLTKLGLSVRTAAPNGADVRFDWDDPATHSPALADVDRVYLLAPVLRTDFAGQVSSFLDLAEAAGVRPRPHPPPLRPHHPPPPPPPGGARPLLSRGPGPETALRRPGVDLPGSRGAPRRAPPPLPHPLRPPPGAAPVGRPRGRPRAEPDAAGVGDGAHAGGLR